MADPLLKIGIVGSVFTALCCFTPLLGIVFGAIGLASLLGYADFVLVPALVVFLATTVYALWKRRLNHSKRIPN